MHEVDCVSYKNPRLCCELLHEYRLKNLLFDVCIQGRNRIIHQNEFSISVDCASKSNSCLLAATEIDSFFANLSLITAWKDFHIAPKLTNFECFVVLVFIIFIAE